MLNAQILLLFLAQPGGGNQAAVEWFTLALFCGAGIFTLAVSLVWICLRSDEKNRRHGDYYEK